MVPFSILGFDTVQLSAGINFSCCLTMCENPAIHYEIPWRSLYLLNIVKLPCEYVQHTLPVLWVTLEEYTTFSITVRIEYSSLKIYCVEQ